jgi:hypothetical protein
MSRKEKHLCGCGHRALFFNRAGPCARRDHPLCLRCWRAAVSRERARQMQLARLRAFVFVPGPFALL